jgi:hypothetical protein
MESETLYRCKSCGESFCSNECGAIAEKLCLFCLDDEDYETEEEYEVQEDDDDW